MLVLSSSQFDAERTFWAYPRDSQMETTHETTAKGRPIIA
jgi:hypothetical protein